MYSVQCTVYSVQCTVYSVQCTVYNVQCTVYSVQCTAVQCTVYTVQCMVHSVQSAYAAHCTLYPIQYNLNSAELYILCRLNISLWNSKHSYICISAYTSGPGHMHTSSAFKQIGKFNSNKSRLSNHFSYNLGKCEQTKLDFHFTISNKQNISQSSHEFTISLQQFIRSNQKRVCA